MLLESARRGDSDAFERLTEPYRGELQFHCYRMLGSLQEAEDLVQETLLRAWRGLDGFQERSGFRSWLYRIATNACLNALASAANPRRVLPEMSGPPSYNVPQGGPAPELTWLEPYPDRAFEGLADTAAGPEAKYELHETVQLAFAAAIQTLPPRQRAVLLLRDVLGWASADVSMLLETSVASVNSALQRARFALEKQYAAGRPSVKPKPDAQQRILLDRYVEAWEGFDLDSFVALLKEDAIYSMPPYREWYLGRERIRSFFGSVWPGYGAFRLVATAANGQPAFAVYSSKRSGAEWQAHSIQVLALEGTAIANLTVFKDPKLFAAFGKPATLPD
jgi:RNA polymerase sigma-70 factor (ECF subfamily)